MKSHIANKNDLKDIQGHGQVYAMTDIQIEWVGATAELTPAVDFS